MQKKLIFEISELINSLKSTGNKSEKFFTEIKKELEFEGLDSNILNKIISCFSITQYSNFNSTQEKVLAGIIDLAKIDYKNVPSSISSNWTENNLLIEYSKYTPCKDIFQAVCDEIGKYYKDRGFKYSRSRPKLSYQDNLIKLDIIFSSSRSNTPGEYVNLEILPNFYSVELSKRSKSKGFLFGHTGIFEHKYTNENSKIRVNQIYGNVLERIDEYSSESVIKDNNSCNVYGIDELKFKKIINFIDNKIIVWVKKLKLEKDVSELIENATGLTQWSLNLNGEEGNSEFKNYVKLKYPNIDLRK